MVCCFTNLYSFYFCPSQLVFFFTLSVEQLTKLNVIYELNTLQNLIHCKSSQKKSGTTDRILTIRTVFSGQFLASCPKNVI